RQQERCQYLPILGMTANVMASDREKILQIGMDDHIGKPINPEEMINAIHRALDKSVRGRVAVGA
ncbi:MAG: hypothetical protein HUJ31_05690, partial [Pseudomonadales bacterium]|nr:hypothetical protein [Pseudomonadales bacterium]